MPVWGVMLISIFCGQDIETYCKQFHYITGFHNIVYSVF